MPFRYHIRPARNYQRSTQSRSRVWYGALSVLVVVTGLLWRSQLMPLPPFPSKYGGDALWALMVFCGMGFVFPGLSTRMLTLLALGFSWAVEFSQLYHAPWIDAVRSTLPGRLILGFSFHWLDLTAYVLGIALGAAGEHLARKARGYTDCQKLLPKRDR